MGIERRRWALPCAFVLLASSKMADTGGEKSKFLGLSAARFAVVEQFRNAGTAGWCAPAAFPYGLADCQSGDYQHGFPRGHSRYFGELRALGLRWINIDVGGGWGLITTATHSSNGQFRSITTSMSMPTRSVAMLRDFCNEQGPAAPHIFSESGRADDRAFTRSWLCRLTLTLSRHNVPLPP